MQKITPNLWFDKNAEEAAAFYTSAFPKGKVGTKTYYPEAGKEIHGMDAGTLLTVDFEIDGYKFLALNGGPVFTFTPALSFMVNFDPSRDPEAREDLDDVWEALAEDGSVLMPLQEYPFSKRYGWIKDKYGVTWQLILTNPEGEPRPYIIPSFMFAGAISGRAEEAINFYTSIFKDTKQGNLTRYSGDPALNPQGMKEGTLMFGDFMLAGQWFAAMDSGQGHDFTYNEAISLIVTCKDQEEIDYYWEKLSASPESEQCGWLKDQFGISWQITPEGMEAMLNDPDKERANRAMAAMLKMKKIIIADLEAAADGE